MVPRRAEPFDVGLDVGGVPDSSTSFSFGFIWIIFRERVGGGGREKSAAVPVDESCWMGVAFFWLSTALIAGGGRRRDKPRGESWDPLFPTMSVEGAGVGGGLARGISETRVIPPCL